MSESANVHGSSPADAARVRKFKLRISIPGKDIGGEWLCQMTGSALAYQSYCGAYGTPRVFTWHHEGDDAYLQDQDGHWLSYEATADCLYMSYKHNRVAWKLEGGRLIRKSDGHLVSWQQRQRWPLSSDHFLQAIAPSDAALTVALVEIEATPIEKLIEKMSPVFVKRFAPLDGVDRYLFTVRSANGTTKPPERQAYAGHDVAFIALNQPDTDEHTVPVYVLQRTSAPENRTYYKLSLQTEEAGYTLAAGAAGAANFHAFPSSSDRAFLGQVYEHSAANPTAGESRYTYDFVAEAHAGWGAGVPVFKAITIKEAEQALIGSLGAESAREYATAWAKVYGDKLAALLSGLGKQDMNRDVMTRMHALFEAMPEPRYMTLGTGIHGGYGIGTTGIELGSIWRQEDFGHVPMHEPLASYSVEWITFGAAGLDLGASVDAVAIGTWYGDISQIEGACNGVTITLQFGVGLSVTLLWDGSWKGANFGPHPIGVTAIVAVGLEAGFGVFYNASATQFWNRRPDFPKL